MTKSTWKISAVIGTVAVVIAAGLAGCNQTPGVTEEGGEAAVAEESGSGWFSSSEPVTYTLASGEAVVIRTTSSLSTKTNQSGEQFVASLEQPLEIDGVVIAPKGARVTGTITDSDAGGRVKGVATMSLALTEIVVDGQAYPVSSSQFVKAAKKTITKDAQKVGIGAGIGAAIGAVAGGAGGALKGAGIGGGAGGGAVVATRGDPAVVPAESVITFTLTGPLTVQVD